MSRAMPADDIVTSTLLFGIADCLTEHEQLGKPLPLDLVADFAAGLQVITQHVMALEAVARAVNVLGQQEYMRAVRTLSTADRRTLAQAALRKSRGGNVVKLPAREGSR